MLGEEENMIRKSKKKIISLLLTAAMTLSLAGCGGGDAKDATGLGSAGSGNADSGTGTQSNAQGGDPTDADGQTAMGRYVEEEIDLSEQLLSPAAMCMLDDGSIVIMDSYKGIFVSRDQGFTWNDETPVWLNDIIKEEMFINSMAMTPDGTAVVSYDSTPGDGEYQPMAKLIRPDGTEVSAEIALTEEDMGVMQVITSDEGRIFADTNSNIYEIFADGSSERVLTPENSDWVWVKGNLMFIDSDWDAFERPRIYDMDAGDYVADDVLEEFTENNYGGRMYNGSYSGTMLLMPCDDDTVYIVGPKGIHRHAIGGNMVEQIVDGNLSLLSNPNHSLVAMLQPEENVFLALCTNHKLIRFTYDPNVPSVPENMITIYSLQEDSNIRHVISFYQMQNPDTFVSYEVGLSGGDSVTREDAIKRLNTEIMAGTGPDLIVLDGMPIDSYISKGLLLDLTDYLTQYSANEPLFDNVIDAMKKDGKAYMAPATIAVPMIAGREEYVGNVTDLSGIGEAVERLREEHPTENIIGICSPSGVMKRFAATSAPKWIGADGTLDLEIIGEYLEQCKRIYDAQMDGIDSEYVQYYTERSERVAAYDGVEEYMLNWNITSDILSCIEKGQYLGTGWINGAYYYAEEMSLDKYTGFEDTKVISMEGQCSNVFRPQTILGINAMSGRIDEAKGFMDVFLSEEVQSQMSTLSGFTLNQNAFDIQFTQDDLGENREYSSWATIAADGTMIDFQSYWPEDKQIAEFKSQIAALDIAYIPDSVLEKAVFDGGRDYINGNTTLQNALDTIERMTALYMAE